MAQQNIDFGSFPDDPSADPIRSAFDKVQNNFNQLFGTNANSTVTSINRTPGAGITVSYPTGNVVVSANIACLQVSTTSLKLGRGTDNTQSNVTITSSSQQLNIDVNPAQVLSNYFASVGNGFALFNGNISSAASSQPNITSLGSLANLSVVGNASFTGANVYINNVANFRLPGGTLGYFLQTDGAGNLAWAAGGGGGAGSPGGINTFVQFNDTGTFGGNTGFTFNKVSGLLSAPSITVTGNITAGNLLGAYSNGNSNVSIPIADGDIILTSNSNTTMTITATGANIIGTANISGNANVGNIGATNANITAMTATGNVAVGNLETAGNVAASRLISNVATGTSPLVVTSTTVVANLSAATASTVITAAQPNITSVGTLSSLAVTANANVGNLNTSGNAIVAGNLTVLGNATYYNIESFSVEDPIITLGGGANGVPLTTNDGKDRGLQLQYYTTTPVSAFIGWDNGNSEFAFGSNVTISSGEIVTYNELGNVRGLTWLGNVDGTYANFTGNIYTTGNADLGNTATANYFVGRFYGTANAAIVANTVVDNAQSNITSVGTLTSLAVTGNTTSGNFVGRLANGNSNVNIPAADGNVTISAIGNANIIVVTGTGVNVAGTGNFTGNLAASAFYGPLSNGNSNVGIAASNGNVTLTAVGNTTMTVTGTGANITGTANITGNIIAGNISATNHTGTTANITGQYITTLAAGTAPFVVTSPTQIANMNVAASGTAVTVSGAAQTSITSVGTLTSLNVVATVTATAFTANTGVFTGNGAGLTNLAGANVTSTVPTANNSSYLGGTIASSYLLTTGTGTSLTSITGANVTGTVANANVTNLITVTTATAGNTYLLLANAVTGVVAETANAVFVANSSNGALHATTFVGTLSGAATSAGSATTAGTVTTNAQPNITSVGTLTSMTSSGNVQGANLITTGYQIRSVATAISAAGTTQGGATVITKEINVVSTVASGAGVVLPTAVAGMVITITNTSANGLLIYPASGGKINSLATNGAFSEGAGATLQFIAPTTTQWYTVGATYA